MLDILNFVVHLWLGLDDALSVIFLENQSSFPPWGSRKNGEKWSEEVNAMQLKKKKKKKEKKRMCL